MPTICTAPGAMVSRLASFFPTSLVLIALLAGCGGDAASPPGGSGTALSAAGNVQAASAGEGDEASPSRTGEDSAICKSGVESRGTTAATARPAGTPALQIQPGDHICLVGNALGERMQFMNSWEMLLHSRFPDKELVVRNLCFPGDEPFHRIRSLNFGTPDDYLRLCQADVILYFFGSNEAFAGPAGVKKFKDDLVRLATEQGAKEFSSKGKPRIVLISPIAHEDLGDSNITDGREHNRNLEMYTAAMREAAEEAGVGFVDLFTPTRKLFAETDEPLTINGIHLNEAGDAAVGLVLDEGLFGSRAEPVEPNERLRAEIADRNFHWFHRYRAVNGYYIYGNRNTAGSDGTYDNKAVMERELAVLDQMCANRDQRIWDVAQGKDVPEEVDDSNTLPLIEPKTNITIDKRQAPKLGSLEYKSSAEQLKTFELAPGYEINLFASEEDFPELANPVAMNFDNAGRLWVAVMPQYPQWKPKTPMSDKLVILEDTDGDGKADTSSVFVDDLHLPTGFEFGYGGVFVAQQPDIVFLKDTDGDGKADVRIRKLMGFDTADSHHGLSAFEWGPDGGLYFCEGTFKQSQIETPYGPVRLSDAGVWRYDPRTEKFEVFSSFSFANPWGHVFDRWGQNFIADASPGFNYFAAPISGFVAHPDKHPGGSRDRHLDWGGPKSNRAFPTFIVKRTRPSSGCEIISSRHFPPEAQGNFLLNNVIGDLAVLQHRVWEDGSGFAGEEITPLVTCTDGNFRPVDLQFGPDGALYIVDWHNALIGHLQHNLRDPSRDRSHGRVWRVTAKGRDLIEPPRIAGAPIEDLLNLLQEPEDRTRYRARRELMERDTAQVTAALEKWIAALDQGDEEHERHLLEALWVCQTHNVVNRPLLERVLESPDYRARAAATRVLSYWRDQVDDALELLRPRIHDMDPGVRLEAVRACSFIHTRESLELALDAVNYELDEYLDYTLDETLRALEHALGSAGGPLAMDEHAHHGQAAGDHEQHEAAAQPRPVVFLDKPRAVVDYQLARLSNSQLLLVERDASRETSSPVYEAILTRPGMSRQDREESLKALRALKSSSAVEELLAAMGRSQAKTRAERLAIEQLAMLLVELPKSELQAQEASLIAAASAKGANSRAPAFAGLVAAGESAKAWEMAAKTPETKAPFLSGLRLLSGRPELEALREEVVNCLAESEPPAVRREAVLALAALPGQKAESFRLAAALFDEPKLRPVVVRTLLAIPKKDRPEDTSREVVTSLVAMAEAAPTEERTTDEFLEAMHLADELLGALPTDESRAFRERLRAVVVRVVQLGTVQEEMRYDRPYFVVEAGRPVQVVLKNEDLMPHNLVITRPGKLREVAALAAGMTSSGGAKGKQFVPESEDVLFATGMVAAGATERLTFEAPATPGEYPYVCTFPNHWMRMNGVMLVTPDLDAWQANPQEPADPLGNARPLVKNWTLDDLAPELEEGLRGRTVEIGKKIFTEATCQQCHKVRGDGGAVGPDLTEVFKRWKGDRVAVLREMIDPSHKIEPKYALYNVVTKDGLVLSGIITQQDAQTVTLVTNPEKPQAQTIERSEIEEMIKSSASMMPKGLLDRFSKDEIFELLSFLESSGPTDVSAGASSGGP